MRYFPGILEIALAMGEFKNAAVIAEVTAWVPTVAEYMAPAWRGHALSCFKRTYIEANPDSCCRELTKADSRRSQSWATINL